MIIKTLYEHQWEFFTLKQVIIPYTLDKGNTQKNLQKLIEYKVITKIPDSDVYTADHTNNVYLKSLYAIITIDTLSLPTQPNKAMLYYHENKLRSQKLHHNRVEACLLFVHLIVLAEQKKDPKKRGIDYYNIMMYTIKDHMIDRWVPYADMKNMTKYLLEQAEKGNKTFLLDWIDERKKEKKVFFDLYAEIQTMHISTLSCKQTGALFKKVATAYIDCSSPASIIECALFDTIPTIKKEIATYITEKHGITDTKEIYKELVYLGAPTVLTQINKGDIFIIDVCLKIEKNHPELLDAFCVKNYEEIKDIIERKYTDILKEREMYRNEHILGVSFWKNKSRDFISFIHVLRYHIILGNLEDQKQKINRLPGMNEKKVTDIITKYALPPKLQKHIQLCKQITTITSSRQEKTMKMNSCGQKILNHLASFLGCTTEDLFYCTYDEILLLANDITSLKKTPIKERQKGLFGIQNHDTYFIYTSEEATRLQKLILDNAVDDFSGLRGTTITKGIEVGSCRIIKGINHLSRIQKGDIVVCPRFYLDIEKKANILSGMIIEQDEQEERFINRAKMQDFPIIVNVPNATAIFKQESILHIDGHLARINVLQDFSS